MAYISGVYTATVDMLARVALIVVASALGADGFMPSAPMAVPRNALLGLRRGVLDAPPAGFKARPASLHVASPVQSSGSREGSFMKKKREKDRKEKAEFVKDLAISEEQKEEYLQSVAVYGIHWKKGDGNRCFVS